MLLTAELYMEEVQVHKWEQYIHVSLGVVQIDIESDFGGRTIL